MAHDPLFLPFLISGALAGGFVNGLAGFGTALFALSFWLQILPPPQAVSISVLTSATIGLQGAWIVRREIFFFRRRLARFLLPGLAGIPLGVLALGYADPQLLKLTIAGFMILYGGFFIARQSLPAFDRPTPFIDGLIGFVSGFLGGFSGVSGALPAMWCAMRPWPRARL